MSEIYQPPGSKKLSEIIDRPQLRIGLQGYGGTGKTYSALTFKNPIVLNLDRGLGAHTGRADVIEIPFHNAKFAAQQVTSNYFPWMLRDAILIWMSKEAVRLTKDQTLVIDSLSSIQNAYHLWYAANPVATKGGADQGYAEWKLKLQFFTDLFEVIRRLTCDVILITHEKDKKEKDGTYRGKIKPLLDGAFGDELVGFFTDWFRQKSCEKPDINKYENLHKWGFKTRAEMQFMMDTFPRNTLYFWQTASDDECDCKCSSLLNYPTFIPANYNSFAGHMKHK